MRIKVTVGVLAMLAAFWVIGMINRDNLHRDSYVLCLGATGDSPLVSDEEKALCACVAGQTVAAIPWKSRLPRGLNSLGPEDERRIADAQSQCRPAGRGS